MKQRYEKAVHELLRDINRTGTGKAVFEEIRRQQTPFCDITIKPWFIDPDMEKKIEAAKASLKKDPGSADLKSQISQREKEALADAPNAFATPMGRAPGRRQFGREGRREKALVRFTPANWTHNPINATLGIGVSFVGPGSKPDEMLLHELVHALRIIAGRLNSKRKVPFQKQYDNMEEFLAILIANIYRSEYSSRKHIRAGHDKYFWFTDADAEAFLHKGMNRMHVRHLRLQHPQLFNTLNDVNAPFNPLRGFRDAR